MIVQTTPEIAEGLFEHLLQLQIYEFQIFASKHKIITPDTKIFFEINNLVEQKRDKLTDLFDLYNQLMPDQKTNLASKDDLENTQDYWTPVKDFDISFGSRYSVIPDSNRESRALDPRIREDDKWVRLSPQMGFGIGLHPSTILALQGLEKYIKRKAMQLHGSRLIDVGSGSGILSIYAAKNGIENIIAFEIQDVALKTMRENFYLNNLDGSKIIFNPYITLEQKQEDIRDSKQVLNTTSEMVLEELDFTNTLFVANMRPQDLDMCKDILSYAKHTIISGVLESDNYNLDGDVIKFGEWRGEIS